MSLAIDLLFKLQPPVPVRVSRFKPADIANARRCLYPAEVLANLLVFCFTGLTSGVFRLQRGIRTLLACVLMAESQDSIGRIRTRISRQGEEALGRLAEELARSPVVGAALSGAIGARERATQAQEAALGALSIPSVADIERLTRRVRSVSQRLEAIEDGLDSVESRLEAMLSQIEERSDLTKLEGRLDEIARELAAVREATQSEPKQHPRGQKRLSQTDS